MQWRRFLSKDSVIRVSTQDISTPLLVYFLSIIVIRIFVFD